jgi:PAS domain S-box-containing protein
MSERRRVLFLILIMTLVALIVGGVSIVVLYGAAFEEEEARLVETARSQARLLEAIARFDADYSQDYPGGAEAATLSQIRDAHENYQGFGDTGEFTLARREGDLMVFLLSHRHYDLDLPKSVPFDSDLAEPMRLSLSGQSGTVVGLDYRGANVLAAYEPMGELGWGIVVKIDLAEIRAPFIRASITVGLSAVIVVVMGAVLFLRVTDPLLRRLAESERRFRSTFEQAAVGITHMALDGRYLRTNQRFCDIIGYTQSETLDLNFQEITHPDDLDADMTDSRRLLEGRVRHFSKEKRYVRKDGSIVWVNLTVSLMREPSGAPKYTINVVEDITERVQAESQRDAMLDALRESEERYRLLFEQMLSGFALHEIICDEADRPVDYRFLEINPAFERLTGLRAEDLLGRTVRQAMPGTEQYWIDRYGRVALTGEPVSFENYAQDLDKHYEVVAFSPQLGRFAVIFRDITARRRAEEVLKQRAAQLAILNDVGAKIAAALELDRLLERAARLVQESFNYHHVGLFTLDREQEEMVMKINAGSYTDLYHDHRLKLDVGMVGWVGRHGETLLANDVSAEPRHLNPFPDEDRMVTQSELSVPIKAGGELIGALDVQSPQLNAFDENDVLVIETLADQIAVAMENARLYEVVRQELSERVRAEEQLKKSESRYEVGSVAAIDVLNSQVNLNEQKIQLLSQHVIILMEKHL